MQSSTTRSTTLISTLLDSDVVHKLYRPTIRPWISIIFRRELSSLLEDKEGLGPLLQGQHHQLSVTTHREEYEPIEPPPTQALRAAGQSRMNDLSKTLSATFSLVPTIRATRPSIRKPCLRLTNDTRGIALLLVEWTLRSRLCGTIRLRGWSPGIRLAS